MRHVLDPLIGGLAPWLAERGLPPFRGRQVRQWLFEKRAAEFSAMTDLPAKLREELAAEFRIWTTQIARHSQADDGTEKLLLQLEDGGRIECVLLRDGVRRSARAARPPDDTGSATGSADPWREAAPPSRS